MNNFKNKFKVLQQTYGQADEWTEVKEVLNSESQSVDIGENDFYDPLKNLIIGILSQNTSDRNCTRAYIGLVKRFKKIIPTIIANASETKIRDSIKAGGLYNVKAKRIKELAQTILKKYNGDLTKITKLPKKEARKALLELKGIGAKTADVFIGYCMKQDTLPIDTNIERVIKRIGIVNNKSKYDEMKKALAKVLPLKQRLRGHELLIRLGRDFCKPYKPLCIKCPIKKFCKQEEYNEINQ